MIVLYSTVASVFSILRYEGLLTQATDLGIFTQAMYSTIHGRLLYEAVDYQAYGATSFLGVHFSPILLAIVPLYWLFPYAETLLVLQAVVVASGTIPTYLIAKKNGNEKRALAFSSFYLLYAPLLGANLYDFHVESFLPVLLLFTFYLTESHRYGRALITTLLSLPTAIMALPWIATQLFSSHGFPHSVGWQYDFFLIPWIVVGSIQSFNGAGKNWLTRVLKRGIRPPDLFLAGMLVSLIISPVIAGLVLSPSFGGQGYVVSYSPSPQFPEVNSLVQEIGPGPVLVSDHLFPYLANRLDVYDFEPNVPVLGTMTRVPTVQYVLLQKSDLASLPPGLIDAFYPKSSISGVDNSTIYLYQRSPGY